LVFLAPGRFDDGRHGSTFPSLLVKNSWDTHNAFE
jgi:hypothetical protein